MRISSLLDPDMNRFIDALSVLRENVRETMRDMKKNVIERIVYLYNGHGMPPPTINKELWIVSGEREGDKVYQPVKMYRIRVRGRAGGGGW